MESTTPKTGILPSGRLQESFPPWHSHVRQQVAQPRMDGAALSVSSETPANYG